MTGIGTPRGIRRRWIRRPVEPERANRLLRTIGFASCDDLPEEAVCWLEPDQTPRRMDAIFPNGWRASARFTKEGHAELITEFELRVRLIARKEEAAVDG